MANRCGCTSHLFLFCLSESFPSRCSLVLSSSCQWQDCFRPPMHWPLPCQSPLRLETLNLTIVDSQRQPLLESSSLLSQSASFSPSSASVPSCPCAESRTTNTCSKSGAPTAARPSITTGTNTRRLLLCPYWRVLKCLLQAQWHQLLRLGQDHKSLLQHTRQ